MRFVRISGAATLLFFGALTPVYTQDNRQNAEPRDTQGDQRGKSQRKQAAPQGRRDNAASRQQAAQQPERQQPQQQQMQRARPQLQRTDQQARAWQQQQGWQQQGGWKAQTTWQQGRAQQWTSEHRSWAQRGGYGGYYVPQVSFGLYFGSSHAFRLRSRPVMYQGYPRFEYGGYSFLLVDPYPEYWPDDWYNSDNVYIDYDDGYYLYNSRYPAVRLAIMLAL